jgi:hypothetical protein
LPTTSTSTTTSTGQTTGSAATAATSTGQTTAGAPPAPPSGSGIIWSANVPSSAAVNQCWGNCGAGCSNNPNPCGGPSYWSNDWLSTPQYVDDNFPISYCLGSAVITDIYHRYSVTGRWTYHGRSSDGCRLHDNICRAFGDNPLGFIGCVLAVVVPGSSYCSGARDENWSYTYVLDGHSPDPIATYVSAQPCSGEL